MSKIKNTTKKRGGKKRKIEPKTAVGRLLVGALVRVRRQIDREDCACDHPAPTLDGPWCPLCAIDAAAHQNRADVAYKAQALADLAGVVEDDEFDPEEEVEIKAVLLHWTETESDEGIEEGFEAAIMAAEARDDG